MGTILTHPEDRCRSGCLERGILRFAQKDERRTTNHEPKSRSTSAEPSVVWRDVQMVVERGSVVNGCTLCVVVSCANTW